MTDVAHEPSEDCPCGPTVIPVERDDGSIGWLYLHHRLEPREGE